MTRIYTFKRFTLLVIALIIPQLSQSSDDSSCLGSDMFEPGTFKFEDRPFQVIVTDAENNRIPGIEARCKVDSKYSEENVDISNSDGIVTLFMSVDFASCDGQTTYGCDSISFSDKNKVYKPLNDININDAMFNAVVLEKEESKNEVVNSDSNEK